VIGPGKVAGLLGGWKIKLILLGVLGSAFGGWGAYKESLGYARGGFEAHIEAAKQYGEIVGRLQGQLLNAERASHVREKRHRDEISRIADEHKPGDLSPFMQRYYEFLRIRPE